MEKAGKKPQTVLFYDILATFGTQSVKRERNKNEAKETVGTS